MIEYDGLFFENMAEIEAYGAKRSKRRDPTTPEGEIQAIILDYMTSRARFCVWRNNTGVARTGGRYIRYGQAGLADIIGYEVGTGRHIEIEVKAGHGRRTAEQIKRIADSEAAGCVAFFAGSKDELNDNLRNFNLIW